MNAFRSLRDRSRSAGSLGASADQWGKAPPRHTGVRGGSRGVAQIGGNHARVHGLSAACRKGNHDRCFSLSCECECAWHKAGK